MEVKKLTCIECPIGCQIQVTLNGEKVESIVGNACPRGKMYAQDEVVCPKRVVTSTVKAKNGKLLPVKTDKPVKKSEIFEVMKKINSITCEESVKIGDVLYENISDDANLIATGNL